jgi:hypothetical protein
MSTTRPTDAAHPEQGTDEERAALDLALRVLGIQLVLLLALRLTAPSGAAENPVFTPVNVVLLAGVFGTHFYALRQSIQLGVISLSFCLMTPAFVLLPQNSGASPAFFLLVMTLVPALMQRAWRIPRGGLLLIGFGAWTFVSMFAALSEGVAPAMGNPATIFSVMMQSLTELTGIYSTLVNAILVLVFCRSRWSIIAMIAAIVAAVGASSTYGIADVWFDEETAEAAVDGTQAVTRAYVAGLNPNTLGITAAAILPVAITALAAHHRVLRYGAFVASAILICGVFVSGSRSALLLTALVAFVFIPALPWLSSLLRSGLLIAAVALAAFALITQVSAVQRLADADDDETIDFREEAAQAAWQATLDNPVFGVGVGRFRLYNLNEGSGRALAPHNWHLQTSAETGLVGFFLQGAFIVRAIARRRRGRRTESDRLARALAVTMIVFIVGGLSIDFLGYRTVYVSAAVLWAMASYQRSTAYRDATGSLAIPSASHPIGPSAP